VRTAAATDRSRNVCVFSLAFALLGCDVGGTSHEENLLGGPDAMTSTECEFTEPAAVSVGGSNPQGEFEALADGTDMVAVIAPSGLYMLMPSIRARGVDPGQTGRSGHPSDPLVRVDVFKFGARVGGSVEQHLGLSEVRLGFELVDVFTPIDIPPAEFDGYDLELRATVVDACGRTASGLLEIRAVLE